jgi:hypothetical protein
MVNAGNPIGAYETAAIAPAATLVVDDLGNVRVAHKGFWFDHRPVSCVG